MSDKPKLWNKNFISVFAAAFFMSTAYYLLIPTLPLYLVSNLGIDKGNTGVIVSLYVLAALAIRPFSGYMVDRFDRKKLFLYSFVIFVLAFFGYIIAASVVMIVVSRIVHGLIWGIITTSSNTLAIDTLASERRNEGVGYFGMSSNVAMAIGPVIGLFLYDSFDFVVISFVAVAIGLLGIICALFIKTRPRPVDYSQIKKLSLDRFLLVKALLLGINVMMITFSYGVLLSYSAMFGKQIGVYDTGYFFIFMALGIIASRLFSGELMNRGHVDLLCEVSMGMAALCMGAMFFVSTPLSYFTMALLIGLAFGMFMPTTQMMTVDYARHDQRGTATSTYLITFDLGVGAGMMIGGMVAQSFSLNMTFMLSAILCFIGTLYYIFISSKNYARNKLR